jgi:hypothetical protein
MGIGCSPLFRHQYYETIHSVSSSRGRNFEGGAMLCRLNLVGGHKYTQIAAAKEGLKERGSDWASDKTPIAP